MRVRAVRRMRVRRSKVGVCRLRHGRGRLAREVSGDAVLGRTISGSSLR